jgi:hypothetical protein
LYLSDLSDLLFEILFSLCPAAADLRLGGVFKSFEHPDDGRRIAGNIDDRGRTEKAAGSGRRRRG